MQNVVLYLVGLTKGKRLVLEGETLPYTQSDSNLYNNPDKA